MLGIGQKGLILQIATFQIFISANNQCQPTILSHCIDRCRERPYSAEFSARFLPQKGMDGRVTREGVDSPVFAENL